MVMAALAGYLLALALCLPLAWKWDLGVRRVAIGMTVLAALAALVVAALDAVIALPSLVVAALVCGLTMTAATGVLAYRFYRDPERAVPDSPDIVVSPADGEVIYVREARTGMLPTATKHGHDIPLSELVRTPLKVDDATVVGIAMSFLDVHVNRAPIAGRVTVHRKFPGQFGSLRRPEMVARNERATTVIEREGLQVAVVQIASRLVRQIVGFVGEGDELVLGQRIGVIRLGSQVDLVLPTHDVEVLVRPGERVYAGVTVVARVTID